MLMLCDTYHNMIGVGYKRILTVPHVQPHRVENHAVDEPDLKTCFTKGHDYTYSLFRFGLRFLKPCLTTPPGRLVTVAFYLFACLSYPLAFAISVVA